MAGVVTKTGNNAIANIIAFDSNNSIEEGGFSPAHNWKADWQIHLYTASNYTLAHDVTLANLTEATFTNYVAKLLDIAAPTDPAVEGEACSKLVYTPRTEFAVGSTQTILGWYITGKKLFSQTNERVLIAFGDFDVPKDVVDGDTINFSLDHELCRKASESTFIVSDEGLMYYLDVLRGFALEGMVNSSNDEGPFVHLYESETVADEFLAVATDFDECDFPGYSLKEGIAKKPTSVDNGFLIKHTVPIFIRDTGASGSYSVANGYYVSRTGSTFIGYGTFKTADITDFTTVGESLNIQLRLCFDSNIVESDGDVIPPETVTPI